MNSKISVQAFNGRLIEPVRESQGQEGGLAPAQFDPCSNQLPLFDSTVAVEALVIRVKRMLPFIPLAEIEPPPFPI